MAELRIKDDNFITITSFMVNDLDIKGNELIVYAVIYGYSQDGENAYEGSLKYLQAWTKSSKQGVMNALKSLIEKGLIIKEEYYTNGVKFCKYRADLEAKNRLSNKFTTMQVNCIQGVKKVDGGGQISLPGGGQKSLPNNILDNNINNNINNNIKEKYIKEKEKKHKYGEYKNVLLSDEELEKLKSEFPSDWQYWIEKVSSYCASKGKTYKNYLATIRTWARKDNKDNKGELKHGRNQNDNRVNVETDQRFETETEKYWREKGITFGEFEGWGD